MKLRNMFGTWLCKLDRPLVNFLYMKILSYFCVLLLLSHFSCVRLCATP